MKVFESIRTAIRMWLRQRRRSRMAERSLAPTDQKLLSEQPKELPSEQPKELPPEQPQELPPEQPKELPSEQPKELPAEQPKELPPEQPKKLPSEQPKELPPEQPQELPPEQPKELPPEQPRKLPPEQAAEPKSQGRFVRGRLHGAPPGHGHYRLFIPPEANTRPLPLVVMLHGCKQSASDFAAGTGMNAQARESNVFVLYPQQAEGTSYERCWNWFLRPNQLRGRGEPAMIMGLLQQVMQRHTIDPSRIYIGGLSAGAAMAMLVARLYPDVFAAVGAFAGIGPGAAMGPLGALSAMRHGGRSLPPRKMSDMRPLIVFQGDADEVVNPKNAAFIMAANVPPGMNQQISTVEDGGRRVTRTRYVAPGGRVQAELWLVHGLGHAWCGGTRGGSYTDVLGPDASREMLRFFARHALAQAKDRTGDSKLSRKPQPVVTPV